MRAVLKDLSIISFDLALDDSMSMSIGTPRRLGSAVSL